MNKDNTIIYDSFNDYVANYPTAESFREWIHYGRNNSLHIVLLFIPQGKEKRVFSGELPGNYIWLIAEQTYKEVKKKWPETKDYYIVLQDSDDGILRKEFETKKEVLAELERLKQCVPLSIKDLTDFGYEW